MENNKTDSLLQMQITANINEIIEMLKEIKNLAENYPTQQKQIDAEQESEASMEQLHLIFATSKTQLWLRYAMQKILTMLNPIMHEKLPKELLEAHQKVITAYLAFEMITQRQLKSIAVLEEQETMAANYEKLLKTLERYEKYTDAYFETKRVDEISNDESSASLEDASSTAMNILQKQNRELLQDLKYAQAKIDAMDAMLQETRLVKKKEQFSECQKDLENQSKFLTTINALKLDNEKKTKDLAKSQQKIKEMEQQQQERMNLQKECEKVPCGILRKDALLQLEQQKLTRRQRTFEKMKITENKPKTVAENVTNETVDLKLQPQALSDETKEQHSEIENQNKDKNNFNFKTNDLQLMPEKERNEFDRKTTLGKTKPTSLKSLFSVFMDLSKQNDAKDAEVKSLNLTNNNQCDMLKWHSIKYSYSISTPLLQGDTDWDMIGKTFGNRRNRMLEWCRQLLTKYHIKIWDFSKSWSDGLAFCAIVHHYRPDLLQFSEQVDKAVAEKFRLIEEIAQKIGMIQYDTIADVCNKTIPNFIDVMNIVDELVICLVISLREKPSAP